MAVTIEITNQYIRLKTDQTVLDEKEAKSLVTLLKEQTEFRPIILFDFPDVVDVTLSALRTLTRALSTAQHESKISMIATDTVARMVKDQGLTRVFAVYRNIEELIGPEQARRQKTLEFLNTALEAVTYTLQVSANTKASAGKGRVITLEERSTVPTADIAATVGLVSAQFLGTLIIGFPLKTYLTIMSRLLNQEYKELVPEIQDGVAELLNIILGQAKITLNQRGFGIKQAIPTVIRGDQLRVQPPSGKPTVVVPYTSDAGEFYIELTTNT